MRFEICGVTEIISFLVPYIPQKKTLMAKMFKCKHPSIIVGKVSSDGFLLIHSMQHLNNLFINKTRVSSFLKLLYVLSKIMINNQTTELRTFLIPD